MTKRRVLIVGAGKRVLDAALPALRCADDQFEVDSLVGRSARLLENAGHSYDVRAIADLDQAVLNTIDLIYLVVAKNSIPDVIARLSALDVSRIDLLIETPVVRFRHFRHSNRLAAFRNVWVSEDCSVLPWIDTVHAALAAGAIGKLERIEFDRSAYAYHGIAMAKTLLGVRRIARARRRGNMRVLGAKGGLEAHITEPRDYSVGSISWIGSSGRISDSAHSDADTLRLECDADDSLVSGFHVGEFKTELTPEERSLSYGSAPGASPTARMDAMKRVGFLRLLRSIAAGSGAYPLDQGLDDMIVDYHLEKFGWYRANPLTSYGSPLGRLVLGAVSRVGG